MAQLTKNRDPNKNTINGIRGQKIKASTMFSSPPIDGCKASGCQERDTEDK